MMEEKRITPQRIVGLAMFLLKELREKRLDLTDIEDMSEELMGQGYTISEINAAFDWVYDRMEGIDPSEIIFRSNSSKGSIRILHPIERAVLSSEAYGQLIEMQSLGMLSVEDIERILDRVLAIGGPVEASDIRTLVHAYLFEEGTPVNLKNAHHIMNQSSTIH